jgi:FixJ family two-component response regulator
LQASGSELPVVFVTGVADEAARAAALREGCIAFLHKPFPGNLLIEAIERATA